MGTSVEYSLDTIRSQAQRHEALQRSIPTLTTTSNRPTLPQVTAAETTKAGGLSIINGRGCSPSHEPSIHYTTTGDDQLYGGGEGGGGLPSYDLVKSANTGINDSTSRVSPYHVPSPLRSEDAGEGHFTLEPTEEEERTKKPMTFARAKAGCKRFGGYFKRAICYSWTNVLLIALPAGIAAEAAGLNAAIIFAINAVAIVPLAGLLSHATESVASRLGDTLGALLNVSFGNAVELIIFIIALVKDEIRIVQASLLGSILANLLLILGTAFLSGGLRYREQVYNSTVTQTSACLLGLSVMSLLLPTAFHAAFNEANAANADAKVLKVSRGTSIVLLVVYGLYLLFQFKSHAYIYESVLQETIDEESHPGGLYKFMNLSSSSDDSSSCSDESDSGSAATTTKRIKHKFKHKKRRKSSVNTRSTQTAEQVADRPNRQITPASTDLLPPYPRRAHGFRQVNPGLFTTILDDSDNDSMSRTAAVVLLLFSTASVAVCAESMVDAIPVMLESTDTISEAFIGLIILPIVGNVAEHVTAVTVAAKNKIDLAIGVAIGSSLQIALFITPVVVLLGWILDTNMTLYFNIFEMVSLFFTAFLVNFLVLDGRSNYLKGSLLVAAYVIIALGAFFYPNSDEQSSFGGGGTGGKQ